MNGRVKSLKFWSNARKKHYAREKILKTSKTSVGYLTVSLCKNGKKKSFRVNRLVAIAFIDNPDNKPQVNHKDGNKENNTVDNLEWCTCSENQIHAFKTGLNKVSEKHMRLCSELGKKYGKQRMKAVNQYDLQGKLIKTWKKMLCWN